MTSKKNETKAHLTFHLGNICNINNTRKWWSAKFIVAFYSTETIIRHQVSKTCVDVSIQIVCNAYNIQHSNSTQFAQKFYTDATNQKERV